MDSGLWAWGLALGVASYSGGGDLHFQSFSTQCTVAIVTRFAAIPRRREVLLPPSSDLMCRRLGKPVLLFVNHDGRGAIVFKHNYRDDHRGGLFDALGATVRHDDMTRVAQG